VVSTTGLSLNAAPTSSSNGLRAMAGCSFASILRAWLNLQNVPQVQHCPAHVFQQLISKRQNFAVLPLVSDIYGGGSSGWADGRAGVSD